jgi:hypothetical protein
LLSNTAGSSVFNRGMNATGGGAGETGEVFAVTSILTRIAGIGVTALVALSGCVVVEESRPLPPPRPGPAPQVCPQIYAPVCAVRGNQRETMPNQCVAEARGFRVIDDGECRRGPPGRPPVGGPPPISRPPGPPPGQGEPQFCTREYAPVCARRGPVQRTFGNACSAEAEGFQVVRPGGC